MKPSTLITAIEEYLTDYMDFPVKGYALVLALWAVMTHLFESFDALPYLCITASTKQAGKTRLAELLSFIVNNPLFSSGATAAAIFQRLDIDTKDRAKGVTPPTLFMDQSENLSGGGDGDLIHQFLNSGYRRGQHILRVGKSYPSFGPKAFILIGDVYDTLRDRSIVITLRRGTPRKRFLWSLAQTQAEILRDSILSVVAPERQAITDTYPSFLGSEFLSSDRDAEIWAPLFAICDRLCPLRMQELQSLAVDLSTEKTAPARKHKELLADENIALEDQYANRLLLDMKTVLAHHRVMSTMDLINALMELPLGPWRRFRGVGVTPDDIGAMLKRFPGVRPKAVQLGSRKTGTRKIVKGYRVTEVDKAAREAGLL